jgi:hypothetical protein
VRCAFGGAHARVAAVLEQLEQCFCVLVPAGSSAGA